MKNKAFHMPCSFILLLLDFSNGWAQDTASKSFTDHYTFQQPITDIVKTNPFCIIWGTIPFTAEYRLVAESITSGKQAIQIGFSYLGKSPVLKIAENSIQGTGQNIRFLVNGMRFQFAYKFYLSPSRYAPIGLYIAPHLSYATARITDRYHKRYNIYVQGTHFNMSLLCGYQGMKNRSLTYDVFCGFGYKKNTWVEHYGPTTTIPIHLDELGFYNGPYKLSLGCNIGYAF